MIYFVGFCLGMLAGIIATLWYISVKVKKITNFDRQITNDIFNDFLKDNDKIRKL